jgi:two-component system, response regulator YesN
MIKLLIADDEMLEREGLAYIVQTLMPNRFECVLAENGKKAVELAEQIRPDVVFLDIKMPGMNGMDAAEAIKEVAPLCKLIFISAYDHFDYARDAIRLGAHDYLLKPVKRDKLLEVLDRIVNEVTQDRRRRQNDLELKEKLGRMYELAESDCTLHLMQGLEPSEEVLDIVEVARESECTSIVFQLGSANVEHSAEWIETMRDRFSEYAPWLISPLVRSSIVAFLFGNRSRAELLQAAQTLSRYLEQRTSSTVITGIGNTHETPAGWSRSYQEAYQASRVDAESKWRFFDSLSVKIEPMIKIEKQLVENVLQGNTTRAEELAFEYAKSLEPSKRMSRFSDIWVVLEWEAADMGIALTRPELSALSTIDSFVKLIRFAAETCREFHGSSSFSMQRAKEYVEQHFREDLTLEKMAEIAQISPYYFSKQFKATFGQSFVEYVTELRMREASRLILEGKHHLKEVCYAVGYNNPTYFSRVFKKHFGMSPTEWKAQ